jgi:hypothetical protein
VNAGEGVVGEGGVGIALDGEGGYRAGGSVGPGFDLVGCGWMFEVGNGMDKRVEWLVSGGVEVQRAGLGISGYVGGSWGGGAAREQTYEKAGNTEGGKFEDTSSRPCSFRGGHIRISVKRICSNCRTSGCMR